MPTGVHIRNARRQHRHFTDVDASWPNSCSTAPGPSPTISLKR